MSLLTWSITTVSRVSSYAGLGTLSAPNTAIMETLINSLTTFIEKYLGYRVMQTAYTNEEYDTHEGDSLNLKNFPISSSATFTLQRRTSALNEDDWEIVDTQYYHIDYDAGIVYCAGGYEFDRTRRGYRVTYTAGFNFDNATTFLADTAGADIELAAWMLLSALWNRRTSGGGGDADSERIGDYAITYRKIMMENEDIVSLLSKYAKENEVTFITPLQE